jgi:large subunit ribosomal protein L17
LVSALFLTERETTELEPNAPKVKGRIITTLEKAKEVRPMVERCITIAKKGLAAEKAAEQFATTADRRSEEWKAWRQSDNWKKWVAARGPAVTARRHVYRLIVDKQAVEILFSTIAPRFMDRPGGYTRILKLSKPRLGDAGKRAILEFVGKNDRAAKKAAKPSFAADATDSKE